jgi:two-component system, LytTR family, sensor kinase
MTQARVARWGMVAGGVVAFWVVFGMLWGAQSALGATMQGRPPASIVTLMRASVIQMLPWIPVTLSAIAMATRVRLAGWRIGRVAVHFAAAVALAFVANVLVVLTFWIQAGRFNGLGVLAREGAKWGVINFHVALLVYAACVGVTTYVLESRERRARELQLSRVEGQLTRAKLEALTAQIRPHFLFNTLHTIGQMWRSGRATEADAMLDRLGSLFHRVLSSTARPEITLEDELGLVREYFAIEEARFRERLVTRIDVDDPAKACMVPPLILQPLVENAVRHGIAPMPRGGTVTVSARVAEGELRLAVIDDGAGSLAGGAEGTGTGLSNTRQRIAQIYGDRAVMRMEHPADGGTIVTIRLPAVTDAAFAETHA